MLRTLTAYKLHHLLLWVLYYLFWVFAYRSLYADLNTLLQVTAVYLAGHAGMFYTTQYLLIPRVLHRFNAGAFLAGFVGTAGILASLMFVAMGFVFTPQQVQNFQASRVSFIVYLVTSNVLVGGMLVGVKALLDNFKNRRLEERLKTERLESELHYLKAQVNPHFLFNTINSVYVLIKLDPDAAARTLIKLSELLRAQLYEFGEKEIPVEKEIEYLNNYLALEKIRKGENVRVSFIREGNLCGFSIAPLMLMPFLENCFKFVPGGRGTDNCVRVKLRFENGVFEADFFNTREEHNQRNEVGGIGLKNIKRRLELIYPGRHELQIQDQGSGFTVNLKIRIHDGQDTGHCGGR